MLADVTVPCRSKVESPCGFNLCDWESLGGLIFFVPYCLLWWGTKFVLYKGRNRTIVRERIDCSPINWQFVNFKASNFLTTYFMTCIILQKAER